MDSGFPIRIPLLLRCQVFGVYVMSSRLSAGFKPAPCLGFYFLGFSKRPDQEANTDEDKGDAEPLSHIQCHCRFEVNLVFLNEFDKKAHAKHQDKEYAK